MRKSTPTRAACFIALAGFAARRSLQRDLEPYRTEAEVSELLALVSNRDDAEAEQFRSVLLGNLQRRQLDQLAS